MGIEPQHVCVRDQSSGQLDYRGWVILIPLFFLFDTLCCTPYRSAGWECLWMLWMLVLPLDVVYKGCVLTLGHKLASYDVHN